MYPLAKVSQIGFAILGVPLSGMGVLALINTMTLSEVNSYRNVDVAGVLLMSGCLCLIVAFVANLVVRAEED